MRKAETCARERLVKQLLQGVNRRAGEQAVGADGRPLLADYDTPEKVAAALRKAKRGRKRKRAKINAETNALLFFNCNLRVALRAARLVGFPKEQADWMDEMDVWYKSSNSERAMPRQPGTCTPAPPPQQVDTVEADAVHRENPAGALLSIQLPLGGALLLLVPPGASADAVVRGAAAACGLAPSQLALFCGGQRLRGQAPLRQAGGMRVLRVVQRLAGGALELTPEAALTAAFRKFAVGDDGRITKEEFVAALTREGGGRAVTREAAEVEFAQFDAGESGAVPCEAFVAAWSVPALPPHLSPAREVAVGEKAMAKWKKDGGGEIEAVLLSGAVALLDSEWVIKLAARGGKLLPRQALPDEAFLSLSEVQASTCNHHLPVVCISHCWLQPDHPDPHGHNLRVVARALESLLPTWGQRRFAVFFDFCSIYQNCRDRDGAPQGTAFLWLETDGRLADGAVGRFPSENVLFTQALGSLGTFYSHPHTRVLMLTAFPPDYDDRARYTPSGNVASYFERGWCFCESAWAAVVKDWALALDLGKDTGEGEFDEHKCRQGRTAPVLPEEFVAQLASKGFTNGSTDRPRVAGLYGKDFEARLEAATHLIYARLGWGDEEARAVARVLPCAPTLKELILDRNSIGGEGMRALAEALPSAPALKKIDLYGNSIGDEGARALAEALPHAPALEDLWLGNNSIGAKAKEALRTAWGERRGRLIL